MAVGPAGDVYRSDDSIGHSGMTLRDYFAAAALQGMLASNFYDRVKISHALSGIGPPHHNICDFASQLAYEYADRMIEMRKIE